MYKYKEIKSKKEIKKHLENPNDIINEETSKIIFYQEGFVERAIWTNKQKEYLDNRFGILESRIDKLEIRMDNLEIRMEKLEKQVKQNSIGINKIIDILARNGMK